jgi:hypothetical protein
MSTTLICTSVDDDCSANIDVCNSAGQFCDTAGVVDSTVDTCQLAQVGYFATGDDGTQMACSTGYITSSTGSTVCDLCAIGYYSSDGSTGCTACVAGYSTLNTGTLGMESTVCDMCAIGYFLNGGACITQPTPNPTFETTPESNGPPSCIAHCNFDQAPGEDYCPSDCDTSGCTENSNPPKSWIDTYFANNCSACITGENCDFSNGCPTSCDYSACSASTTPTYDEAAYYFANGCVKKPHRLQCSNGMFLKNKNTDHEWCKPCQAGKFSRPRTKRNRRCKKCGINKYQKEEGSTSCTKCPPGFNTKGQRGKKQCFDAITGKSMKHLGIHPYPFGWKNEK